MNKDWMKNKDKLSREYAVGVKEFLNIAKSYANEHGKVRCPCKKCMNALHQPLIGVERHLFTHGMLASYTHWVFHGEPVNIPIPDEQQRLVPSVVENETNSSENRDRTDNEEIRQMLNDIHRQTIESNSDIDETFENVDDSMAGLESEGSNSFEKLLTQVEEDLYTGCTKYSSLNFLVKLMHMKSKNNWSNNSFDELVKFLKDVFSPINARIPASFYEANRKLRDLGLTYESIHACKYDCVLYRNEYKEYTHCPTCGESRYKIRKDETTKIPQKVLRHFPLIPRLKRLFASKHSASDMSWHKDKRVEESDVLRHPADAEGWKHLDREFPQFATDPRNVRLGLSSDGFNPFGNMSTSYSVWPVILVPYNLPPWKCMKESNFIMSLLIPGPKSPGKEIDVYLQPLIEELKELWLTGVQTYDSSKNEYFKLHASLMWTINDFPAYGDLSGWSTKGYKACPICKEQTYSDPICNKISFTGHRRYLPKNHIWRKSKLFNGKPEHEEPPEIWEGDVCFEQVSSMNFPVFSKHPSKQVKKRKQSKTYWRKKSIFYELPYWSKLLIRHKLDVMHIEKNVCDNLVGTLLNLDGKTKDTKNAREDLKNLNIRPELHIQKNGGKEVKPHASYTLTSKDRVEFLKF